MLILAASILYLSHFVSRGWMPHDEGMIGQTAERALAGETPHIQFEEPYTGGLTWAHAALFNLTGVDLLYARWLLFGGAVVGQAFLYSLLRRHFQPIAASIGVCVAMVWSYPNYFAAVPSWWLLICAICILWALIRFQETKQLLFAGLAGLGVGIAITIKQTGVYLAVPVLTSLWLISARRPLGFPWVPHSLVRGLAATSVIIFIVGVIGRRLDTANIAYLVMPVFATCVVFVLWRCDAECLEAPGLAVFVAAGIGMSIPIAVYIVPYMANGHLRAFLYGAFVLPRERLEFASLALPPAGVMVTAIVMAGCLLPIRLRGGSDRILIAARWVIALSGIALSLRYFAIYQIVWQSTRTFTALIPIAASLILLTSSVSATPATRYRIFASASMLAWASLVQFPFGAPIYFCYVAPLAVVAGSAVLRPWWPSVRQYIGPWCALLLGFGVLDLNRSYPFSVGISYMAAPVNTPLRLSKATLEVPEGDAAVYRRTIVLIQEHIGDGTLLAGPDCPEIYFLADRFSPTGSIFDFFSRSRGVAEDERAAGSRARVVVVNHRPSFTPPYSSSTLARLRSDYPYGEMVGHFEVRWR